MVKGNDKGPRIQPQIRMTLQPFTFRIDSITFKKLQAYAGYIESETSYVIREALNYLFDDDPGFQEFLTHWKPTPLAEARGQNKEKSANATV